MISVDLLASADKNALQALAESLSAAELEMLIPLLSDKEDKLRYACFLVLQHRSAISDELYRYWDIFKEKLENDNSYQRSIGLMLLAANARWDRDAKFEALFEKYCALLDDEKLITVRQCIQSFAEIVPYKPGLRTAIADRLMAIDIQRSKETMRKLFLTDILNILLLIRAENGSDRIDAYITDALLGGVLDHKTKKVLQGKLQS